MSTTPKQHALNEYVRIRALGDATATAAAYAEYERISAEAAASVAAYVAANPPAPRTAPPRGLRRAEESAFGDGEIEAIRGRRSARGWRS